MAFKRNGGSVKIHYRRLVCGILNARASAVSHSARRTPATERGWHIHMSHASRQRRTSTPLPGTNRHRRFELGDE